MNKIKVTVITHALSVLGLIVALILYVSPWSPFTQNDEWVNTFYGVFLGVSALMYFLTTGYLIHYFITSNKNE